MAAVAAGKADPIGGAQFFGDLRFDFRFHQGRFRFKEQDVGTGLPQEFRPAAMEVPQRIGTDAVMALIFGSIGQISPVWAGTGQTKRPGPAGLLPFGVPPFLAGVQKDLDCPGDEGFCLFAAVPRFHKARQRGLVTAGNARIGAGPEILDVDFLNQFRPVGQDAGRPQFVIQIGPEIFQGRPHRTDENQDALAVQNLFQCILHFLSPFTGTVP